MPFGRSLPVECLPLSGDPSSRASTATRSTTSGSTTSEPERCLRVISIAVPHRDWAAVEIGAKTEFRLKTGTNVYAAKLPTPVLLYNERDESATMLAVLEEKWREPLAAISAESLEREGYPDMAHFRRYWMGRTGAPFRPLDKVVAYRVRRLSTDDVTPMGIRLLMSLYGEHLDGR